MASQLALRHQYPALVERMREVLTNRQYQEAKLRAVGGPRAELISWHQDTQGVTVVLHQAVPGDAIPPFLRSLLPGDLTIRRTETWRGCRGSVEAVVNGAPGAITGVMLLEPDPAGCVLGAQLTAEVPLPLIGGKVENYVAGMLDKLLTKDAELGQIWLAER